MSDSESRLTPGPEVPADAGTPGDGDVVLLARTAAGDRRAFEHFVERHQAAVYRYARTLVGRPEDAEDVLQQTFLAAWRGAAGFRGDASGRTWVLTVARHAAHRYRSRVAPEPADDPSLEELGLRAGWGGPSPERLAMAAEERARVVAALASLAPADREILTLRDLEALSGDETAALLGITVAAMKSRLHRARLALAARLTTEVSSATRRT